jgi:sRNA-binding regulator protein Hfq
MSKGTPRKPQGPPRGGGAPRKPVKRAAPPKLEPEAKAEMKRLMDEECLRKPIARRIAAGEMTLEQFKMRYPQEYARSYRAKNLLEQNPGMTRARAFWLSEDANRVQSMREKQIRTFATQTGLSLEQSQAIAAGDSSLPGLAKQDERWSFIWDRARGYMKRCKEAGRTVSPMEAIRWARGDFGLDFAPEEDPDAIERLGQELHDRYPFMKKRHTRRMARFDLDLDGLACVAPANCGWGPRALALYTRFPGHHRKFIRLMAMMNLDDQQAADFIQKTAPAREKYAELASSGRRYYFRLYDGDFEARLIKDDNPFSWRLTDADPDRPKQSKLQVLFLCPAEARGAIFGLAKRDEDLALKKLGPAFNAEDRLDQDHILEHLDRARANQKNVSISLRNGLIFEGNAEWYSPFEVMLRLQNNAWMMILFHSIHKVEVR